MAFEAGKYYDVVAEAMSILKRDAANVKALFLRGKSFFFLGELDAAINHMRQCVNVVRGGLLEFVVALSTVLSSFFAFTIHFTGS